MFGSDRKELQSVADATTLIAAGTEIRGDILFTGRLHVDGAIEGQIRGEGGHAILTLSERAKVIGELHAPHMIIDGSLVGDVTALDHLELTGNACVDGNVYYNVLEISAGAKINGSVIRRGESGAGIDAGARRKIDADKNAN